ALLELSELSGVERQLVDAHASVLAGEMERRSAPALGSAGLAQRQGHRTPAELVRVTTRTSLREASSAIRVGRLVQESLPVVDPVTGELAAATEPWLAPVGAAVLAGTLSVASADSIRSGLGKPTEGVAEHALQDAAAHLCATAADLDPDRLFRAARDLRDQLDAVGIADRERHRHEMRSLRFVRQAEGMSRLIWLLDPESAAAVGELYDRATSPRRGGPRFVSEEDHAQTIADDTRTTEQLASDEFLGLLRNGAHADSTQLLGSGAPSVRVLVTADALTSRTGHGRLEGQPDPVSLETVERLACTGNITALTFTSDGQPLDVGREQRLFTRRQKVALAARDGGCLFPGCDRPPSWTEAHHIKHWVRDAGETNIEDGVLLCRHHHLLTHNNHWEIERHGTAYWLIPPPDIDPHQKRIPLPTKSAALRDLLARAG
ncbi:MAG: DUF222 domain-containing protein, partial [Rhodoglobus sp.]|nr:DUF222 domain-containing protein [Rhodoglobus sp.]